MRWYWWGRRSEETRVEMAARVARSNNERELRDLRDEINELVCAYEVVKRDVHAALLQFTLRHESYLRDMKREAVIDLQEELVKYHNGLTEALNGIRQRLPEKAP